MEKSGQILTIRRDAVGEEATDAFQQRTIWGYNMARVEFSALHHKFSLILIRVVEFYFLIYKVTLSFYFS